MVAFGFNLEDYGASRLERLRSLDGLYRETNNALYLWKIIGICLEDLDHQETLPIGVLKYLRWVSTQLESATQTRRVRGQKAAQHAGQALYLLSQKKGQKNRFAALAEDAADMALARAAKLDPKLALTSAMRQMGIDSERARKRLARGRKLLLGRPMPGRK